MNLDVWVPCQTDDEAERVALAWFDAAVAALPPGFWDRVLDQSTRIVETQFEFAGDPLAPFAVTMTTGISSSTPRPVRAKTWPPAFNKLGHTQLVRLVSVGMFGAQGSQDYMHPGPVFSIGREINQADESRDWVNVSATAGPPEHGSDLGAFTWVHAWLMTAARAFLSQNACTFGHIRQAVKPVFYTTVLGGGWLAVPDRLVPTYEWVTIVNESIASQLGGPESLRESGAFWDVTELAGGCLWLQATEFSEEFDQQAGERVFDVLVDFLPPEVIPAEHFEERYRPYAMYGRAGRGPAL